MVIITALILLNIVPGAAIDYNSLCRGQREISVIAGYGENHRIPTSMKEHFTFDQLSLRWGRFTSPTTEVDYEINGGRPVSGMEKLTIMGTIGYRRYFSTHKKSAWSYGLNGGVAHFGDYINGQATRWNFTEQASIAYHRSTGNNSAFTIEYRFCHVSNAGIKRPNVGINASAISIGYTWFK